MLKKDIQGRFDTVQGTKLPIGSDRPQPSEYSSAGVNYTLRYGARALKAATGCLATRYAAPELKRADDEIGALDCDRSSKRSSWRPATSEPFFSETTFHASAKSMRPQNCNMSLAGK